MTLKVLAYSRISVISWSTNVNRGVVLTYPSIDRCARGLCKHASTAVMSG